jgi:ubiquitin-like 1-activating enzyme E1 B
VHFYSDREEFDEEKEPDGMLLSGWNQASSVEKDDSKSIGNGGTTSNASQTVPVEAEKDDEMSNVHSGKKRKLSEVPEAAAQDFSGVSDKTRKNKKLEVVDDDDDFVMLEGDPGIYKKKKLQ